MYRRISNAQAQALIRQHGARSSQLGDYGNDDPNTLRPPVVYSEREVFRSGTTISRDVPTVLTPNRINFLVTPFSQALASGSQQILPANELRQFLMVQNQSTVAIMYVNFGVSAGINVGIQLYPAQGIILDTVVPANAVYIFVDNATNEPGAVVEGALTL